MWEKHKARLGESKKRNRTDLTLNKNVILGGNNLIVITRKIISLVGRDIVIKHDKERVRPAYSEVERLCADNKMARNVLG